MEKKCKHKWVEVRCSWNPACKEKHLVCERCQPEQLEVKARY